jgi:diacylglycerol kinase (ATP)
MQFVNKLIYAREGAKDMMDRSCSDLPWHVALEVDGKNIEIPEVTCLPISKEGSISFDMSVLCDCSWRSSLIWYSNQDAEGVIVMNIGSYMGGVDLWLNDNEHDDDFSLQSMHDKMLEVVCISGTWHLGKLQVQTSCLLSISSYSVLPVIRNRLVFSNSVMVLSCNHLFFVIDRWDFQEHTG